MSELNTVPEGAAEGTSESTAAPETAAPASGDTEAAPSTAQKDPDAELKAVWKKNNPDRDDDGKFASDSVPDEEQNTDSAPKTEAKVPVEEHKMPQSWSAEVTELWNRAPPELKAQIAKREAQAHETITRQGQQLKAHEPIARLVDQHRQTFERYGVDPSAGINQLLAANDYLERDPVNAISDLARAYGVEHAFAGRPQGQPQSASPEAAALRAEIDRLNQQLQTTDQRLNQRDQFEAERHIQSIETQVAEFAKDKPDFAELADDVEEQILAIKSKNPHLPPNEVLQKAYERARRVNPEVSARLEAEAKKAEEAKRIAEAKKRATEAKRAAPLSVPSAPSNSTNPRSVDDTLREVARKAYRS